LYLSQVVFTTIKSRRVSWTGHVAHKIENRIAYSAFLGKVKKKVTTKTYIPMKG
jgi:hypothetical protein